MIIHIPLFNKESTSIDAITICFCILVWIKNPSITLLKHEQCHVEQWKKQPFTYHLKYFSEMIANKKENNTWRQAYLDISYEKEAREYAKKFS
jgi:hypothetical protein